MDIKHHNQTASYTPDETATLDNGRQALAQLKRTFLTWVEIGRAVRMLDKKAKSIGGRQIFALLMSENGFPIKRDGRGVFEKATISRLLQIMEPQTLPQVLAWHEQLEDHQKLAWASPESVFKRCPVFAGGGKDRASAPAPKPTLQEHVVQLENELARIKANGGELFTAKDNNKTVARVLFEMFRESRFLGLIDEQIKLAIEAELLTKAEAKAREAKIRASVKEQILNR
jgi:hypothetical protein